MSYTLKPECIRHAWRMHLSEISCFVIMEQKSVQFKAWSLVYSKQGGNSEREGADYESLRSPGDVNACSKKLAWISLVQTFLNALQILNEICSDKYSINSRPRNAALSIRSKITHCVFFGLELEKSLQIFIRTTVNQTVSASLCNV